MFGFGLNQAHEFFTMNSQELADKVIKIFEEAIDEGADIQDENIQMELFAIAGGNLSDMTASDQRRVVDTIKCYRQLIEREIHAVDSDIDFF